MRTASEIPSTVKLDPRAAAEALLARGVSSYEAVHAVAVEEFGPSISRIFPEANKGTSEFENAY